MEQLARVLASYLRREGVLNAIRPRGELHIEDPAVAYVLALAGFCAPLFWLAMISGRGWLSSLLLASAWGTVLAVGYGVTLAPLLHRVVGEDEVVLGRVLRDPRDKRREAGSVVLHLGVVYLGVRLLGLEGAAAFGWAALLAGLQLCGFVGGGIVGLLLHALLAITAEARRGVLSQVRRGFAKFHVAFAMTLAVAMLTFFTSEIWQSIGGLGTLRFAGACAIVWLYPVWFSIAASRAANEQLMAEASQELLTARLGVASGMLRGCPPIEEGLSSKTLAPDDLIGLYVALKNREVRVALRLLINRLTRAARASLLTRLGVYGLLVASCMFLFFLSLATAVLGPGTASAWGGGTTGWSAGAAVKVCAFLATITGAVFLVQCQTEEEFTRQFLGDLRHTARNWLAAGLAYEVALAPGRQELPPLMHRARQGMLNARIVLPTGADDEMAKAEMRGYLAGFEGYQYTMVWGFPDAKTSSEDAYVPGQLPAWRYLKIERTGVEEFGKFETGRPLDLAGTSGNTEVAGRLARKLESATQMRTAVYGVRVFEGENNMMLCDVRLTRRFVRSEDELALGMSLLETAVQTLGPDHPMLICVYVQDEPMYDASVVPLGEGKVMVTLRGGDMRLLDMPNVPASDRPDSGPGGA